MKSHRVSFASLLPLVLAATSLPSLAQTWSRTLDPAGDPARLQDLRQTPDGGFVAVGQVGQVGEQRSFLMRLGPTGELELFRRLTSPGPFGPWTAMAVLPTDDGEYVVSTTDGVLRLDAQGELEWFREPRDELIWPEIPSFNAGFGRIARAADGSLLVPGSPAFPARGSGVNRFLGYAVVAPDGSTFEPVVLHCDQSLGGYDGLQEARVVEPTDDGGMLVAGWSWDFNLDYELAVAKLDPDGAVEWSHATATVDWNEVANRALEVADRGYWIVGTTGPACCGAVYDAWVLRLDQDGDVLWQKSYGTVEGREYVGGIAPSDNGVIIAGATDSFGAGERDGWLFELDGTGEIVWQRTYGGPADDFFRSLERTHDGGYVVAGESASFGSGALQPWILKLDSAGNADSGCPVSGTSAFVGVPTNDPLPAAVHAQPAQPWTLVAPPLASLPESPVPTELCYSPAPGVQVLGGAVGGTLSFLHDFPCCPGSWALTLLGTSGDAGQLTLPGDILVHLTVDNVTSKFVRLVELSAVRLNRVGRGRTAPIPLTDPALVGLELWLSAAVADPVTGVFEAGTVTTTFRLE